MNDYNPAQALIDRKGFENLEYDEMIELLSQYEDSERLEFLSLYQIRTRIMMLAKNRYVGL